MDRSHYGVKVLHMQVTYVCAGDTAHFGRSLDALTPRQVGAHASITTHTLGRAAAHQTYNYGGATIIRGSLGAVGGGGNGRRHLVSRQTLKPTTHELSEILNNYAFLAVLTIQLTSFGRFRVNRSTARETCYYV